MSGFSIDWLNLREEADRRARDRPLLEKAQQWLATQPQSNSKNVVVDLGAGTGSTLRMFPASGTGSTSASVIWRLVDRDQDLLAEAHRRHGQTHTIEICLADLAQVATLPFADARLVTASALFDLVSGDFVKALAGALKTKGAKQPVAVYAALNYDGMTRWTPVHPMDDSVLAAFNRDQRRDKGFGPALGPDAGTFAEDVFVQAGYTVHSASSHWKLDATDQAMVSALIGGIFDAVKQDNSLDPEALQDWVQFRKLNVSTGTCIVGHTDVLALPTGP